MSDLSIVIVTWNNRTYLEPCLESLYAEPTRSRFDVVIVDNGSTDGTQAMLAERYPEIALIQNDRNVGLGKACNQGIVATAGRHVLLLNDDTLVNAPSLDQMVEYLDAHRQTAAVGGRLLNDDGSVQHCYNDFSTLGEEFLIATRLGEMLWEGYPSIVDETRERAVDWICSACLMVRRAALEEVGLLDERYFIYGDEADLQYRFHRAGWSVVFLPQPETVHFGGRSLNRWRRRRMVYRGKMLFYRKHYGRVRTGLLRLLLAGLSASKMVCWGFGLLLPTSRVRAGRELSSNLEVIRLCARLT